ncbi:hypothetical protein Ocin01_09297 [Orchesella cincta]|uniref:Uncharacterized protein n=1 Tax=Orchesella cincta TaxID=48709 RepID=A0A1D2MWE6_ORCCI|nr:hypothetical protein Ocin01_09297 [Orchesella cincta]
MPMTMRKRKIMIDYDFEDDRNPPPIKKNLISKTKYKTTSGKKLNNNSASKTQGVSRSARLSLRANDVVPVRKRSTRLSLLSNHTVPVWKERRKTGVLYSLAEIHNRPIGSIRKEDPRNAMFNFSSSSLYAVPLRQFQQEQIVKGHLQMYPTVRSRGRAGASGKGRSGGNASLISHLPDQRRFRNVAEGVSLQNSPPSGRLSIGRILMQPNASFELYEKRSSTTVYTVLKGCPTFIIENLGVNDKGKEGSLFTNTPGSTLKLRNGSSEALIAFSTFNLK